MLLYTNLSRAKLHQTTWLSMSRQWAHESWESRILMPRGFWAPDLLNWKCPFQKNYATFLGVCQRTLTDPGQGQEQARRTSRTATHKHQKCNLSHSDRLTHALTQNTCKRHHIVLIRGWIGFPSASSRIHCSMLVSLFFAFTSRPELRQPLIRMSVQSLIPDQEAQRPCNWSNLRSQVDNAG